MIKILIAIPYLDPIHPEVEAITQQCCNNSNNDFCFNYLKAFGSDLALQREQLVSLALDHNQDAVWHQDGDQPYNGSLSTLLYYLWNTQHTVIGCAYPWREGKKDKYVAGYFNDRIPNGNVSIEQTGIIPVGWCGHGSMLVRMDYYKRLEKIQGDRLFYDPEWYVDNMGKRHRVSESIGFGLKCKKLDIPVMLDCEHVFRHEKALI